MLDRRPTTLWIALAVATTGLLPGRAEALDLGASGRISTGTQDNDDTEIDQDQQRIVAHLGQQITPWFGFNLSYHFDRFVNELETGESTERKTTQPQLVLYYGRPKFTGQLTFLDRKTRTTFESGDLDVNSIVGDFQFKPDRGPRYALRFRDNNNVADPGVFGRETSSFGTEFDVVYDRNALTAVYSYIYNTVDNEVTGLSIDQNRHVGRVTYADRMMGGRLGVGGEARISRLNQDATIPPGESLAEPIPAREGLFVVDTTPAVSTLDPQPGLIDGNTVSPTLPPIMIGGANTFRNIGLDLGFTRPASRLEVYVDAPSGPNLIWQVWTSPDNLQWTTLLGSTTTFDAGRLVYTLRFPVSTARFFKVVNLSVNILDNVNVTEIRALVDVDTSVPVAPDATNYRLNANASYEFSPRLNANTMFEYRSDENFAAGFVDSGRDQWNSFTSFRFSINPELGLSAGYRRSQIDESSGLVLARREDNFNVKLDWTPLPSVSGAIGASHYEERSGSQRIRKVDSIDGRIGTQLFPDLWLNSELRYTRVDDPFSGFLQTSWTLRETVTSRPARNWTLDGNVVLTKFDSVGLSTLTYQTRGSVRTTWAPVPFITFVGEWNLGRDDNQRSLSQRYSMRWSPGTKLSTVVSYYDFEAKNVNKTANTSATLRYALLRGLDLFATLNRSVFEQTGLPTSERTNFRVGIDFIF